MVKMNHILSAKNWTQEPGYKRGILLPSGNKKHPNVQIQLTEIIAGDKVAPHRHPKQTEFIYFLEGSCDFIIGNRRVTMQPEHLLIIEPGERHSTMNNSGITARFLTFKLNVSPKDIVWE